MDLMPSPVSQITLDRVADLPNPIPELVRSAYISTRHELWTVKDGRWWFDHNVALFSFKYDLLKVCRAIHPMGSLEELEPYVDKYEDAHGAIKNGNLVLEILGEEALDDAFKEVEVRWVMES